MQIDIVPICIRSETKAVRTRHRRRTIWYVEDAEDAVNNGITMNTNWKVKGCQS